MEQVAPQSPRRTFQPGPTSRDSPRAACLSPAAAVVSVLAAGMSWDDQWKGETYPTNRPCPQCGHLFLPGGGRYCYKCGHVPMAPDPDWSVPDGLLPEAAFFGEEEGY
eukprot:g18145.t1